MQKADAYLVDDLDKPGEYLVRPSCVAVEGKNGMQFRFRNLTRNDQVWVKLPEGVRGGNEPEFKKAGTGKHDAATFSLQYVDGAFRYEVFVTDAKSRKAKGESDPVIIIDPPTP